MFDITGHRREQFGVKIQCPACKQTGSAIWEEAVSPGPAGPEPSLVSLPSGFVQRQRANLAAVPELVCESCGAVVLD